MLSVALGRLSPEQREAHAKADPDLSGSAAEQAESLPRAGSVALVRGGFRRAKPDPGPLRRRSEQR